MSISNDPVRPTGQTPTQAARQESPQQGPPPTSTAAPQANPALAQYHADSFEAAPARATPVGMPAISAPPRQEGVRFDPNNPADVEALAQQYAPIRYLHPDEANGPGDPLLFIENARIREDKFGPDSTVVENGEIDPAALPGMDGDNLYMDIPDSDAARAGTPNAPSFYQYDPATNTMTYWQFYNYNDAPDALGFENNVNHEGDWERVTVQFDDDMNPVEVRYSSHSGNTTLPWDEAPKEDGRPVVYTALGSHANSPFTGPQPTEVSFVDDTFTDDGGHLGERIDTAETPLLNVQDQPWYDTDVHWGSNGYLESTSGPHGPGSEKGPLR